MADLYLPPVEDLRDQFLQDLELAAIDAGVEEPPIEVGTDWYGLAVAEANLHAISLQNIALTQNDITPLTADEPKLDEWRQAFGLPVVNASAARGRIIVETTGSVSIIAGTQWTHAKGTRYSAVDTTVGVSNNDEIEVVCLDAGEKGNLDAGETVQLVGSVTNLKTKATVSATETLQNGTDSESPDRKRERILNRSANAPGGGNWGQLRQIALESSPAVKDAYVYPALGGPGSCKVVVARAFDPARRVYSRSPSATLVEVVRTAIQTRAADGYAIVVQAVADENVDVSLLVTIPDSILSGGNGHGWLDSTPWPSLNGDTYVAVTAVTSERIITVGGLVATGATAGQTRVSWYSRVDKAFLTRTVTARSGAAGAWVLTLDAPLSSSDGSIVAVGDYICPAAANIAAYGTTWRDILMALGPGENTASSDRLPRAKRHPYTDTEDSPDLNASQLRALGNAHPEILDVSYSYRSATGPTVPAAIATAPNVLVPNHFAIYPL